MDVVLTDQGRRALARGNLKFSYFSLSDASVFYEDDIVSGSSDVTSRVYSECAPDLPQDVISLLVDESRQVDRVRSSALSGSMRVYGGSIVQGLSASLVLSGSGFSEVADTVLSSSLENLRNNFLLGSVDEFFGDDDFVVSPTAVEFLLTPESDKRPTVNVSSLEGFFQDPLLSHTDNFMYLPPINKQVDGETRSERLGEYPSLGGDVSFDFDDVQEELRQASRRGRLKTFQFDPAPRTNNIQIQIFEQTRSTLSKLDVVDFGSHRGDKGQVVHVYFVGKVYHDDFGVETFVRLFTLTLE